MIGSVVNPSLCPRPLPLALLAATTTITDNALIVRPHRDPGGLLLAIQ